MLFFNRTVARCPNTPLPDFSTASSTPPVLAQPSSASSSDDTACWELLSTPRTPPNSGQATPIFAVTLSQCSSFDTDAFPAESYMYPSDRNGTLRTEAVRALQHPTETAASLHRHASESNRPTCRDKLQDLADTASENFNARLNQAFGGHDLVELGNRVTKLIPSISMPSMRQLGQTIDLVSDIALSLTERCWSETGFWNQDLQGDQWAFARIMNAKARQTLVKQNICREWQVVPNQITSPWIDQLNSALAAMFAREKQSFGVAALFSMTPVWSADTAERTWRLELDTGLMSIEVDLKTDEFSEQAIFLAVGFELPESCASLTLADVESCGRRWGMDGGG